VAVFSGFGVSMAEKPSMLEEEKIGENIRRNNVAGASKKSRERHGWRNINVVIMSMKINVNAMHPVMKSVIEMKPVWLKAIVISAVSYKCKLQAEMAAMTSVGLNLYLQKANGCLIVYSLVIFNPLWIAWRPA